MTGFDRLRQETVVIKRPPPDTAAAASETAAYTMLDAFRRQNLLCTRVQTTLIPAKRRVVDTRQQ